MKALISYLIIIFFILYEHATLFSQVELNYDNNETVTYDEAISLYQKLSQQYETAKLLTYGMTDAGKPLHLFVISRNKDFDPISLKKKNKRIILINNGIHPGEPCGVDASIQLANNILVNKSGIGKHLENTVICIIPIYNIGGALNRGCCSRANQNGPKEYGFRGNAKNLDLNRDFIKCDSENASTFTKIFQEWNPDIFVDTHTSNGADYQYVMTLIATQHNKLHPTLASYLNNKMLPALYKSMAATPYEMIPYVHTVDKIPDNGIAAFLETPRYSSGYTALFNTIGFITETHMFKPFKNRVLATYEFLVQLIEFTNTNAERIGQIREKANQETSLQKQFTLTWKLDTTKYDLVNFKGFEAKYKTSEVTGNERLYYDRQAPFEKEIRYFNYYLQEKTVQKPAYYIIPQSWKEVIDRLEWNGITMKRLSKDTSLTVEAYYIKGKDTGKQPFEGHYLHKNVEVEKIVQAVQYYKGDYIVETNQSKNRYIVETLEPQSVDSYFCWNFFDAVIQQKEWFSPYVFEEKAAEILEKKPALKKEFEEKKSKDAEFAKSDWMQLHFIYQNSDNYEKTHNLLPVTRINEPVKLPLN